MKYLILITFIAFSVFATSINTVKAEDSNKTYDLQQTYNTQTQEAEWSNQLTDYARLLQGRHTGQCVLALRNYFGVPKTEVSGLAKSTKANSQTPKVGAVIILKMSWAGHVGIVLSVRGEIVTYFDSNGSWTQRGAIRTININDRRISGYRIIK